MRKSSVLFLAVSCVAASALLAAPAQAAHKRHGKAQSFIQDDRYADFVIDPANGQILHATNEDAVRYPASLTKMMTLYLTFEALESGKLSMNDQVRVSAHAAAQAPSSIGVSAGQTVLVRDMVLATIIKSANDAAVVLAEALGGSEDHFADLMTAKARALGMDHTTFRNASGLPNPEQKTTARDLAKLGAALFRDHPQYYKLFSQTRFVFRGQTVNGHNRLMARYRGADGIKTGFINMSGFNLVTSAERDGRRLVGVVMGGETAQARDNRMAALLDQGFAKPGAAPVPASPNDFLAAAKIAPQTPAQPVQPAQPLLAAAPQATPPVAKAADINTTVKFDAAAITAAIQPVAAEPPALPPVPAARSGKGLRLPSLIARAEAATGEPGSTAALASAKSGWVIQLGAFGKSHLAEAMLTKAASAAPHLLRGAETVIVPSSSAGKTFYRARMVGFDQDDAQAACQSLKAKKFTCLVLSPAASSL